MPCYVYRYVQAPPDGALDALADEGGEVDISAGQAGVPHSAELFTLFGLTSFWLGYEEEDRTLSQRMQGYWTRFAATGVPGGSGAESPAWPRFTPAAPELLELAHRITVKPARADPLIPLVERSWDTTTY